MSYSVPLPAGSGGPPKQSPLIIPVFMGNPRTQGPYSQVPTSDYPGQPSSTSMGLSQLASGMKPGELKAIVGEPTWCPDLDEPMARFKLNGLFWALFGAQFQLQGTVPEWLHKKLVDMGNYVRAHSAGSFTGGRIYGGAMAVGQRISMWLESHSSNWFSFFSVIVGVLAFINAVQPSWFKINAPLNWDHTFVCVMAGVWAIAAFLAWKFKSFVALHTKLTLLIYTVVFAVDAIVLAAVGSMDNTYIDMHLSSSILLIMPLQAHMGEILTTATFVEMIKQYEGPQQYMPGVTPMYPNPTNG